MVIVPQFKINTMLTAENKDAILETLKSTFPNDTPKIKGGGPDELEIFINVNSIDKNQLWELSDTVFGTKVECDVDLKRSGTGITIHFN